MFIYIFFTEAMLGVKENFHYNNEVFNWLPKSNRFHFQTEESLTPHEEVKKMFSFMQNHTKRELKALPEDILVYMEQDDLLEIYDLEGRLSYFTDNFLSLSSTGCDAFIYSFRNLYKRSSSVILSINSTLKQRMEDNSNNPLVITDQIPPHEIEETANERRRFLYTPKCFWRVNNEDESPFGFLVLSNAKLIK